MNSITITIPLNLFWLIIFAIILIAVFFHIWGYLRGEKATIKGWKREH